MHRELLLPSDWGDTVPIAVAQTASDNVGSNGCWLLGVAIRVLEAYVENESSDA